MRPTFDEIAGEIGMAVEIKEAVVNYILGVWDEAYKEGVSDGYEDGLVEGEERGSTQSYQAGYDAGHNTFINQIVHTLDFRGQEAMIDHIERAIGFQVTAGNMVSRSSS